MEKYSQPGKRKSYGADQRAIAAEQEAIRRNKTRQPKSVGLAKLGATPADSWQPGTIWMKTLDEPEA